MAEIKVASCQSHNVQIRLDLHLLELFRGRLNGKSFLYTQP